MTSDLAVHSTVRTELERRDRFLDECDPGADPAREILPGRASRVGGEEGLAPVVEVPHCEFHCRRIAREHDVTPWRRACIVRLDALFHLHRSDPRRRKCQVRCHARWH